MFHTKNVNFFKYVEFHATYLYNINIDTELRHPELVSAFFYIIYHIKVKAINDKPKDQKNIRLKQELLTSVKNNLSSIQMKHKVSEFAKILTNLLYFHKLMPESYL